MNDTDVIIIGGGISGLSTAWWLAQAGVSVQVWEADERIGGKIKSQQQAGYLTERAASLLMNFRPEVAQLVRDAGLDAVKTQRSLQAEAKRYLLNDGQLQALPMRIGGMLTSPLWSLRGKLRLLMEPFIRAAGHDDETVSEFIRRRLGNEMLEKAIEPFVAGTLAADPDLASAGATLPRLTALENRFGSITAGIFMHRILRRRTACGTDTFSFRGGMSTLVNTLARAPGIQVLSHRRVSNIAPTPAGWCVSAESPDGERSLNAAHVVMATPAPAAANLVSPLCAELASLVDEIRYAPLAILHMGLNRDDIDHPLDGSGFLAPRQEKQPFNGNLWMSSLFEDRAPAGKALLTTYLGGSRHPEAAAWDDTRLVDEALHALMPLLGIRGGPEMVRIDRHAQALPLYHGAYLARDQAIGQHLQALPGLHMEANYRGGVSVRDRIVRGQALAQRISQQLHTSTANKITTALPQLPAHPVFTPHSHR